MLQFWLERSQWSAQGQQRPMLYDSPTCAVSASSHMRIYRSRSRQHRQETHGALCPGIFPLLRLGPKAAEQAGLSRLCREKVCPACRTLPEKRNRTEALSSRRAGVEAADFASDPDARVESTAPPVGSFVRPAAGTIGRSSRGVAANHEPALATGKAADGAPVTAADGAPVTTADCAPASSVEFVAMAVADCVPIAAADCAPAMPVDCAGVAGRTAGPAQPSVDSAIATVAAASGIINGTQRLSVGAIRRVHLVAENPRALRARAANGRDLPYTRETVPLQAVVGGRHARRRSFEASGTVSRLCRDDGAAVETVLMSVCLRER